MTKYVEEFIKHSFIHESLLNGYLWLNPLLYQKYKPHKIIKETFTEDVWYFYFNLGREMYSNGIRSFDEKTVYSYIVSRPKEVGRKSYIDAYNMFGGYDTIYELMEACEEDEGNDEYHFSEVQKYESLRKMQDESLLNPDDKELIKKLCKMNLKQMKAYFEVKIKESFAQINSGEVVEHNLTEGLRDVIDNLNAGETMGMPLHDAPRLNKKIKGWKDGSLYYLVMASGNGKSTFAQEKFILGLFENKEKGILAINEESNQKWQESLLNVVANKVNNAQLNKEKMYEGNFDKVTLDKLEKAADWAEKHGMIGQQELIKVLEMKRYRVEDILSRVELYRPRGYKKLIIDTFKPDTSNKEMARWEAFSNSAQEIHDIIKADNYNVGTLATVQLKIGEETRYLDLESIGKSKEIVEVAAVVMMGRLMYDDEREGKYKVHCYNWVKDKFSGSWIPEDYELKPNKRYMILFLPKNRFGKTDEQILYEANYDFSSFKEVALCKVPRIGKF